MDGSRLLNIHVSFKISISQFPHLYLRVCFPVSPFPYFSSSTSLDHCTGSDAKISLCCCRKHRLKSHVERIVGIPIQSSPRGPSFVSWSGVWFYGKLQALHTHTHTHTHTHLNWPRAVDDFILVGQAKGFSLLILFWPRSDSKRPVWSKSLTASLRSQGKPPALGYKHSWKLCEESEMCWPPSYFLLLILVYLAYRFTVILIMWSHNSWETEIWLYYEVLRNSFSLAAHNLHKD